LEKFFVIYFDKLYFKLIFMMDLGIGDWGLGIGDWGLGPIPLPQILFDGNEIKKL